MRQARAGVRPCGGQAVQGGGDCPERWAELRAGWESVESGGQGGRRPRVDVPACCWRMMSAASHAAPTARHAPSNHSVAGADGASVDSMCTRGRNRLATAAGSGAGPHRRNRWPGRPRPCARPGRTGRRSAGRSTCWTPGRAANRSGSRTWEPLPTRLDAGGACPISRQRMRRARGGGVTIRRQPGSARVNPDQPGSVQSSPDQRERPDRQARQQARRAEGRHSSPDPSAFSALPVPRVDARVPGRGSPGAQGRVSSSSSTVSASPAPPSVSGRSR